ncbi:MAG TPA: lanthionine synthetase LanC family protein [Blastocatellia bacterium]|jgi:lantibiotic modifying enzyme|nr:lanthionine synthetase LanC family protein [Blastocatellia bacterium]
MRPAIALLLLLAMASTSSGLAPGPNREAAMRAAKWIRASAIESGGGRAWPSDPKDPKSVAPNLYGGVAGVVVFFLQAFYSTGDQSFLQDAKAGADYLLGELDREQEPGLYSGLAGIGFTLLETYKATKISTYREGAARCAQRLAERATKTPRGVHWNDTNDIIGGSAGVGLFLLYAERELGQPRYLELAVLAGKELLARGQAQRVGMKWAMSPQFPRLMPNFSHGTAGIAYFLASLYSRTKDRPFLEGAIAGAEYLKSVARTEGDVCLVFHNEPDGKELYYMSWCHGPAGTARLFYRLYRITGEKEWMAWVNRSARAVIESGVPEKQTPGFWNNVSQCCGSAGVAEFFLDLYHVTHDRAYLERARRVAAHLLGKATSEGEGLKWIQAEHRVKPDLLVAQTGFMQGAAGVGMLLLRLDDIERGKHTRVIFPDSPFQ